MKTVTFEQIVPGMVLYDARDVKPPEKKYLTSYIIVEKTLPVGNDEKLWEGEPALYFVEPHDAHLGICATGGNHLLEHTWFVVEDQSELDMLREEAKKNINNHRDHLVKCERLINANL